jgi:hypothetical protein
VYPNRPEEMLNSHRSSILSTLSALAAGVLVFTACSSSGGNANESVSQSKLEAKLRSDTAVTSALKSGGVDASKTDVVITCIAQTLDKDGNHSDLNKYIGGKITLDDIKGRNGATATTSKNDSANCVKKALGTS